MKRLFIAICVISLLSCTKNEPSSSPVDVFETLWSDFDKHYPIFKERGIDWDSLYSVYRPMVDNTISQDSLWDIISDMLYQTEDGHVVLRNTNGRVMSGNGRVHYPINVYIRSAVDITLDNSTESINDQLSWGQIADKSIGYIHIGDFSLYSYQIGDINILAEKLAPFKSVIIDIRDLRGGYAGYGFELASWFTPEPYLAYYVEKKDGPEDNDYAPAVAIYNYVRPNNYSDKEIVVLTNHRTVSAGEHFTLATKGFRSVTQIGTPTAGFISMIGINRFLPNGWTYYYPVERITAPDGSCPEGIGVIPDIWVANDDMEKEDYKDFVLERAIEFLQNK